MSKLVIKKRVQPVIIYNKFFPMSISNEINNIFIANKTSADDIYEFCGLLYEDEKNIDYVRNTPYIEDIFKSNCFSYQIEIDKLSKDVSSGVVEGIYKCNKCNGKKTIRMTLTARSGDEGAVTYIVCIKCNTKWKESN